MLLDFGTLDSLVSLFKLQSASFGSAFRVVSLWRDNTSERSPVAKHMKSAVMIVSGPVVE